ncbi:tRNA pseudouridine(55) synthase TruB [Moraxella marmotae]|uniref:tRNA pseudouridine(55) synthase TruB n=1 Tax=Moraxella marmotae TaxID=3344520 RepID=UPI0035F3BE07
MSQSNPKTIISGVLLLNKPAGISSHSALARAKHLFKSDCQDSKKAGHTGTLDPMATGLLPVCFGEATKFSQYGLDADKGYTALIRLGEQTDTGDKEGQVIATAAVPSFDQTQLNTIANAMLGEQQQVPPMYSALKKDGKKLYEYARAGIEVERAARPIAIYQLALSSVDAQTVALSVLCSKGTYVRVLGEEIAARLGTVGHLTQLHRTATGGFDVAESLSLDELDKLAMPERLQRLLPVDAMLGHLPILQVNADQSQRLRLGQRLNVKDQFATLPPFKSAQSADTVMLVRLYADGGFIGLAEVAHSGRLQPKKLLA